MQSSDFLQNWLRVADEPKLAVLDGTGRYSFRDITQKAERITSSLLQGRSSLAGARVGILIEPGVYFVASFIGILSAGGTVVVLSPLHPNTESAYFCQDGCIETIIVSTSWKNRVEEFAPRIPILEVESICKKASAKASVPLIQSDAPALQLYTSGTTGKPKGAVLTHGNLAAQQRLLKEAWGLRSSDILLHILPLHHMHGLCIALWSVLGAGGCVSFVYPFDPAKVWSEMGNSSVFMAVPTIYAKLFNHLENASPEFKETWRAAAENLRLATSGSAALPVSLAEKWQTLTGKYPLERFGMTEVGVALSNPLMGKRKPGRVGLPLPSVQYKVVNEAGEESEVGELWIGGPSVFSEYFQCPKATQSAFLIEGDIRFFRTGDTVTRDEEGYFKILGRNSVDILKSGGYKLSAIEIEEVFRAHPAVAEVAVVGVPDAVWGDRVIACVVLKEKQGAPCSENLLRDFAKSQMAAYKVPRQVVFLEKLPSNSLGKVLKQDLVKQLIVRC
jgi:malonyl-CoA/methylmalonyl-CoA synthetase